MLWQFSFSSTTKRRSTFTNQSPPPLTHTRPPPQPVQKEMSAKRKNTGSQL